MLSSSIRMQYEAYPSHYVAPQQFTIILKAPAGGT